MFRFIRSLWSGAFAISLFVGSTVVVPTAAAQSIGTSPIGGVQPDLTASLSASSSALGGEQRFYYTLTIRNPGLVATRDAPDSPPLYFNTPTTGVKFELKLPAGSPWASLQSATGLQNRCDTPNSNPECSGFQCLISAPTVTCIGGHLGTEESASFNVWTAAQSAVGSYTATLKVDPANAIAERSETNNTASTTVVVQRPELSVSISPSATSVEDGGTLTYVLNVVNTGPSARADDVAVQLTLPTGATASVDRSRSDGTCTFGAPILSCTGLDLAAATSLRPSTGRITVAVTLPLVNGPVSLTALVDPANTIPERDDSNNSATVTTTVIGRPDLVVSANQWHLMPLILVRDVTVRNTGLAPASGVDVIVDAFNDGLFDGQYYWHNLDVMLSWSAGGGFTCTSSRTQRMDLPDFAQGWRLRCTGGSIPVGGSVTIERLDLLGVGSHAGDRWTSAIVDPDNTIREQRETNNTASAT
ncbi:MAG TPA: CARDB domain-containing protein [Chloroflexota bacterium]|jgi:hypothetical protein